MRRVTTILSDVGNVVAMCDERKAHEAIGKLAGRTADEVKMYMQGDGTDRFKPFRVFMRGECDADRFRETVSRELGCRRTLPKKAFERAFCDIFLPNPLILDLWRTLCREGLTVTAVSNMEALRAAHLEKMGVLGVFDHIVMSYREGLLKPSEDLMIRALDLSGAKAEETIFVDDKPKNFPPCEKLGIRTCRYFSFDGLLWYLKRNGVIRG